MKKYIITGFAFVVLLTLSALFVHAKDFDSDEYSQIQDKNMASYSLNLDSYFFSSVDIANKQFDNMSSILIKDSGTLVFNQDNTKVFKIISDTELVLIIQNSETIHKGTCDIKKVDLKKVNDFFDKINIDYSLTL